MGVRHGVSVVIERGADRARRLPTFVTRGIRPAAASLIVVGALAVSGCGGGETAPATAATAATSAPTLAPATLGDAVVRVRSQLRGIAQQGLVLGSPGAPVAIVEYAKLDGCPACSRVHSSLLPAVIARYVRTGQVSLEFRAVATTDRSHDLALGAHAASPQHRGWDVIQLAYLWGRGRSQTPRESESSERLVRSLGLDLGRWREDRRKPLWRSLIGAALQVVNATRIEGSPVFLVRRVGYDGPFVVVTAPTTVDEFSTAIEEARRASA
jgi:protein-disulfide isomerase